MILLFGSALACLVAIFVLAMAESSVTRLSRVSLRVLAERDPEVALLEEVVRDRVQFLLPLQFTIQILTAAVAVITTILLVQYQLTPFWAIAVMVAVIALVRQLGPRTITQRNPERFLLRILPVLSKVYRLLVFLTAPLLWILKRSQRKHPPSSPELSQEVISDEEIQAYLDVGEEEGIFEEEESELIQSALEFGSTVVREIMTPRSEMIAVEDSATISKLKDLIVSSKHSRIPVYRDSLDEIVGVVYVRNLLAFLEQGQGGDSIAPLIKKAWFVPETKRVSDLLKEMQENSEPLAIVVSEYGSVSGLVTIEDLLEEIVGEIYDEDELQVVELEKEGDGTLKIRGALEVEDLEEALEIDLGDPEVTTVSGLVVAHLGKVPTVGERVELDGLEFEILEADPKRIILMRVRKEISDETAESSQPAPSSEP